MLRCPVVALLLDTALTRAHITGYNYRMTVSDPSAPQGHAPDNQADPTVSIIIATRNAGRTLNRCLDSLEGIADTIEIIIKDCISPDETASVAQSWMDRFPRLRFISKPDSGIGDAWNQALAYDGGPIGEWILFLGADDFLRSQERFAETIAKLSRLPGTIDYAVAPVELVSERGTAIDTLPPSRNLERDLPCGMPFPHQGVFHRRGLFNGQEFDPTLKIVGDYDFLCRTLTANNFAYLEVDPFICMSLGGVSGNLRHMLERNMEALAVSRRYHPRYSRYPLMKRIFLSRMFQLLAAIFGEKFAVACADTYRAINGKTKIWTK